MENHIEEIDADEDESGEDEGQQKGMKKKAILALWHGLEPHDPATAVTPIPYKHSGPKFDQDSIRITGSCNFINSVLSNLKSIIKLDSKLNKTRLQVNYMPTEDRETGLPSGSWVCYIQVHKRGEGKRGKKKKKFHW